MAPETCRIRAIHHRRCISVLVAVCALTTTAARAELFESPISCELVVREALAAAPETLRALFSTSAESVYAAAFQDSASCGQKLTQDARDRHLAAIDAEFSGNVPDAERESIVRRFPVERLRAESLYRANPPAGGILPWVIEERYADLVNAFRTRDWKSVPQHSGTLLHAVTDAGLPFHTSRLRYDVDPWFEKVDAENSNVEGCSAGRIQVALLDRNRERLAHEVRVFRARAGRLDDGTRAVFALLQRSCLEAAGLRLIDREIIAQLGIHDATSWSANREEYFRRLEERALPVMRAQLESAALLGANLIHTAWWEAGSSLPPDSHPPIGTSQTAVVPRTLAPPSTTVHGPNHPASSLREDSTGRMESNPEPGRNPATETAALVGSTGSQVFHRSTCNHAQRIKKENLVRFTTVEAARSAGRTPCKTCQPDGP